MCQQVRDRLHHDQARRVTVIDPPSQPTTSTRGILFNEEFVTLEVLNNSILEREELHANTMLKFSRGLRVMNIKHLITFADEKDCIICQESVLQGFRCNNCTMVICQNCFVQSMANTRNTIVENDAITFKCCICRANFVDTILPTPLPTARNSYHENENVV